VQDIRPGAATANSRIALIRDQVLKGRCATNVELPCAMNDSDGMTPLKMRKQLSVEIWEESLRRGPWKTIFDTFWDNYRCSRCATCEAHGLSGGEGHDGLVQEMARAQLISGNLGACTADSGYMSDELQEDAKIKFEYITGL
jgi:hypothetical protein